MFHKLEAEEKFAALGTKILYEKGISLRHGDDFEEFAELVSLARNGHTVGNPFNPKKIDLTGGRGTWILGYDEHGNIMHTQALRRLEMPKVSLAEYMRVNFKNFPPPDTDVDFKRSRYRPGPGAKRICGNVVYSGETWIEGQTGKHRGTGLSALLGRYAMLTAVTTFRPDYMMGFITRPVANAGYVIRFGFMHAEPMALRWQVKKSVTPIDCFMVYMSSEDIEFVLDMSSAEHEALAA